MSLSETIKAGDQNQVRYLTDRYHYLLTQKLECEDIIRHAADQSKTMQLIMTQYLDIKAELIMVDEKRTNLVHHE
jgi:hypothetical protein